MKDFENVNSILTWDEEYNFYGKIEVFLMYEDIPLCTNNESKEITDRAGEMVHTLFLHKISLIPSSLIRQLQGI